MFVNSGVNLQHTCVGASGICLNWPYMYSVQGWQIEAHLGSALSIWHGGVINYTFCMEGWQAAAQLETAFLIWQGGVIRRQAVRMLQPGVHIYIFCHPVPFLPMPHPPHISW